MIKKIKNDSNNNKNSDNNEYISYINCAYAAKKEGIKINLLDFHYIYNVIKPFIIIILNFQFY